jgi:response regulator RpfG family c-di-GMP phosphodiesterase
VLAGTSVKQVLSLCRSIYRMKIRKRLLLVVLVAGAQLACLCGAIAVFASWLQNDLESTARSQVLADNKQFAAQMATMIRAMGLHDLRRDGPDWVRLQRAVEQIKLPNQGFVCVVENGKGQILCHPHLRSQPSLASIQLGKVILSNGSLSRSILDSTSPGGGGGGTATIGGSVHVIGVSDLPELNVKVLAHQDEAGVDAAATRTVQSVRQMGIATALVLSLLSAAVTTAIVRRYENRLADINANLECLVEVRSQALMRTRDAVIFGLAKLAESRDDDTGAHLERIRDYVEVLALEMMSADSSLNANSIRLLVQASSLHDIGKVGIPDAVLCKPGKLTPDERTIIQKHPAIGGECLFAIKKVMGDDDFLKTACEVAFSHHERWDGAGYPFGLSGENIPLSGRIVAVADVYDALTSKRVYKDAMSHEVAARIIGEGSGSQFDPAVVTAFLRNQLAFARIAEAAKRLLNIAA